MYMSTRANLDYWSTDNCCLKWSLKTGAITIGFLSTVWQSLMVMSGVMMLVSCPVPLNTTDTNTTTTATTTTTTTTTNLTLASDTLTLDAMGGTGNVAVGATKPDEIIEDSDKRVKCLAEDSGAGGGVREVPVMGSASGYAESGDSKNNISISDSGNLSDSNSSSSNETELFLINCPWLPDPETEVLGVYSEEKLFLVAGIFIAYSGIYCILSLCVVVGAFTSSVTLLHGWVAFTGFHNMLVLASLLVPLPFTTLSHLFLSITYFIMSLYTWAVVKSYMHALKVELNKPLLPEGSITDYTVDGVDVTEIPVQV